MKIVNKLAWSTVSADTNKDTKNITVSRIKIPTRTPDFVCIPYGADKGESIYWFDEMFNIFGSQENNWYFLVEILGILYYIHIRKDTSKRGHINKTNVEVTQEENAVQIAYQNWKADKALLKD